MAVTAIAPSAGIAVRRRIHGAGVGPDATVAGAGELLLSAEQQRRSRWGLFPRGGQRQPVTSLEPHPPSRQAQGQRDNGKIAGSAGSDTTWRRNEAQLLETPVRLAVACRPHPAQKYLSRAA